jgi:RNA polymerase sigma-70 factor (ECF subfamily)
VEDETELLRRLRAGDEAAFATLVDRMHRSLLRLAELFVGRGSAAEEVVQDTWVGVLDGLDRFEGRSSLKTWIGSILVNRAKTRRARDHREQVLHVAPGDNEPEDGRLNGIGYWCEAPSQLPAPDDVLAKKRALAVLLAEIERLPEGQRLVVTLRDVSEWSSEEVCNVLGLSETNQRVLLHRGRTKLRAALVRRFGKAGEP